MNNYEKRKLIGVVKILWLNFNKKSDFYYKNNSWFKKWYPILSEYYDLTNLKEYWKKYNKKDIWNYLENYLKQVFYKKKLKTSFFYLF